MRASQAAQAGGFADGQLSGNYNPAANAAANAAAKAAAAAAAGFHNPAAAGPPAFNNPGAFNNPAGFLDEDGVWRLEEVPDDPIPKDFKASTERDVEWEIEKNLDYLIELSSEKFRWVFGEAVEGPALPPGTLAPAPAPAAVTPPVASAAYDTGANLPLNLPDAKSAGAAFIGNLE
jgi:hypothetical protein